MIITKVQFNYYSAKILINSDSNYYCNIAELRSAQLEALYLQYNFKIKTSWKKYKFLI